jgi:hypothetical protein
MRFISYKLHLTSADYKDPLSAREAHAIAGQLRENTAIFDGHIYTAFGTDFRVTKSGFWLGSNNKPCFSIELTRLPDSAAGYAGK